MTLAEPAPAAGFLPPIALTAVIVPLVLIPRFRLPGRFLDMDGKTAPKTRTVMETLLGTIGFALALIGWTLS